MQEFTLMHHKQLLVRQRHEVAEWVGFETRNKYEIITENQQPVAFAAEQQKGFFGFLARQVLGHWRSFEIHFFSPDRAPVLLAKQPFRFFFQRLEISDPNGRFLGALQKRFSIFSKKFDVEDSTGSILMEVSSPIWKIWTFPFVRHGKEVAFVRKKWSGFFTETFTDKDNFVVEFADPTLTDPQRKLVLAAALFIDLRYFEKKARR